MSNTTDVAKGEARALRGVGGAWGSPYSAPATGLHATIKDLDCKHFGIPQ